MTRVPFQLHPLFLFFGPYVIDVGSDDARAALVSAASVAALDAGRGWEGKAERHGGGNLRVVKASCCLAEGVNAKEPEDTYTLPSSQLAPSSPGLPTAAPSGPRGARKDSVLAVSRDEYA